MVKPRIVETNAGIQDEQTAAGYDKIMRTDRVLKPGGKYYISDLVREMNPVIRYFMKKSTKSPELVSGLISSINASYTKREAEYLLVNTDLKVYKITTNPFSIFVKGIK